MASSPSLKLAINVPETIALAYREGVSVSSQFGGDQVMFTLCDGRKFYASPFVANKIAEAGIGANQLFTIVKREETAGNRRIVSYEVTPEAAMLPAAVNGRGMRAVAAAPAPAIAGARVPPPAALAAAPAADSSAILAAGIAAIDAVLEVEQYAQSRGMVDFSFGAENIQKVWLTLYIDARKGGRA